MDHAAGIEPTCPVWKTGTSPIGQAWMDVAVDWNRTSGLHVTNVLLCRLSYDSKVVLAVGFEPT
jgi:hypothetical protein